MPHSTRIPRRVEDFDSYIQLVVPFLLTGTPTNAERLSILPEEAQTLESYLEKWLPDMKKYKDRMHSRTMAVNERLSLIITDVIEYDQKHRILDRVAASPNATADDLMLFNIGTGMLQKTKHSAAATRIYEPVSVNFQLLGGGSVAIKCYSSTGQRAGIFQEADSVQYLYMTGTTPPTSTDDPGFMKDISTRGIFTLDLGSANSGKNIYLYLRWYCTKHPELAGPWSALQTTLIA